MAKKKTSPDITLNEEQKNALSLLFKWWKHPSAPLFQISGAAGTGKTTLIKYMIKEIGLKKEEVLFVAYVGKATLAMSRTGLNAKTIHSAICRAIEEPIYDKDGKQLIIDGVPQYTTKFVRREYLDECVKLIVVDEGAMVPKRLAEWLMSYKIPIIVLGDLNQLPPVMGKSYFLQEPDAILTEIMRQSNQSPIPYLARMISEGKTEFTKECVIADKIRFVKYYHANEKYYTDADIVICPTNSQRDQLNHFLREDVFQRKEDYPIQGDKMICRKNDWKRVIQSNIYLINGMIGYVEDIHLESLHAGSIDIDFRPEFIKDDMYCNVTLDRLYLNMDYENKRNWFSRLDQFEYGYAITCHLAQGSQYQNVTVDMTQLRGSKKYRSQWLYTAVTRAIDTLTIII